MATLETAPTSLAPKSPVPLNTIPISPAKDSDSTASDDDNNTVKPSGSSKTSRAGDEPITTVLHDPENFNVKHPLMNECTLWFTKPPSGKVRQTVQVLFWERIWLNLL